MRGGGAAFRAAVAACCLATIAGGCESDDGINHAPEDDDLTGHWELHATLPPDVSADRIEAQVEEGTVADEGSDATDEDLDTGTITVSLYIDSLEGVVTGEASGYIVEGDIVDDRVNLTLVRVLEDDDFEEILFELQLTTDGRLVGTGSGRVAVALAESEPEERLALLEQSVPAAEQQEDFDPETGAPDEEVLDLDLAAAGELLGMDLMGIDEDVPVELTAEQALMLDEMMEGMADAEDVPAFTPYRFVDISLSGVNVQRLSAESVVPENGVFSDIIDTAKSVCSSTLSTVVSQVRKHCRKCDKAIKKFAGKVRPMDLCTVGKEGNGVYLLGKRGPGNLHKFFTMTTFRTGLGVCEVKGFNFRVKMRRSMHTSNSLLDDLEDDLNAMPDEISGLFGLPKSDTNDGARKISNLADQLRNVRASYGHFAVSAALSLRTGNWSLYVQRSPTVTAMFNHCPSGLRRRGNRLYVLPHLCNSTFRAAHKTVYAITNAFVKFAKKADDAGLMDFDGGDWIFRGTNIKDRFQLRAGFYCDGGTGGWNNSVMFFYLFGNTRVDYR